MRSSVPDTFPVLGAGKHRRARDGACFMEVASVLAGERWTDRPRCTHPLLAHLARLVNDFTSDDARSQLATLIPSVIGLRSKDRRWDLEISLLAASRALPHADGPDQQALAAAVLTTDRLLEVADGRSRLRPDSAAALAAAPVAARWARDFTAGLAPVRVKDHPSSTIVDYSVRALAQAGGPEADERLREVLTDAVELCQGMRHTDTGPHTTAPRRVPWLPQPAPGAPEGAGGGASGRPRAGTAAPSAG